MRMPQNLQITRTISGDGAMVGRLSWDHDGKEYGAERECGDEEEDLTEAIEECIPDLIRWASESVEDAI